MRDDLGRRCFSDPRMVISSLAIGGNIDRPGRTRIAFALAARAASSIIPPWLAVRCSNPANPLGEFRMPLALGEAAAVGASARMHVMLRVLLARVRRRAPPSPQPSPRSETPIQPRYTVCSRALAPTAAGQTAVLAPWQGATRGCLLRSACRHSQKYLRPALAERPGPGRHFCARLPPVQHPSQPASVEALLARNCSMVMAHCILAPWLASSGPWVPEGRNTISPSLPCTFASTFLPLASCILGAQCLAGQS
jgi:hypothetical protein